MFKSHALSLKRQAAQDYRRRESPAIPTPPKLGPWSEFFERSEKGLFREGVLSQSVVKRLFEHDSAARLRIPYDVLCCSLSPPPSSLLA